MVSGLISSYQSRASAVPVDQVVRFDLLTDPGSMCTGASPHCPPQQRAHRPCASSLGFPYATVSYPYILSWPRGMLIAHGGPHGARGSVDFPDAREGTTECRHLSRCNCVPHSTPQHLLAQATGTLSCVGQTLGDTMGTMNLITVPSPPLPKAGHPQRRFFP